MARSFRSRLSQIAGGFLFALALGLFAVAGSARASSHLPSLADLAERLQPTVVNISTETVVQARRGIPGMPGDPWSEFFRRFFEGSPFFDLPETPEQRRSSLGSGCIIDAGGLILTNNHVIEKASEITVIFHDQKKRKAEVVGRDRRTDLALLQVKTTPGEQLPAAKLGDSSHLRVGDWVVAIGNPFGLSHTVTTGIVSAKGRVIGAGPYDDFIQTDASINPGNSGGPLFNLEGEVVGINTAIFSRGGGNIGIGFAIPVNMAKQIIPQLRKGTVTRGFLGVSIQPVTEAIARGFGLKEARGALVADLVAGGPAADAGVKRGDIIVGLNGKEVDSPRSLSRMAAGLHPGSVAQLDIIRRGDRTTVPLKVGTMPDETRASKESPPEQTSQKLGLRLQTLTPEIARQIGVDETEGVVIVSVTPGSPAAQARLMRGDVIIEANQKRVRNIAEFQTALQPGKANLLLVNRRGTTLFVPIEATG